ncbi:hypothetical protein IWQ60_000217 [Tieghemiomyces parasiticus]|uniref:Uncharacterized protein n=1 Tax=Tieghemiomyces parasiticus TaxID=78921 RepID=A0A9W8E2Y9_9FUNG|nr:hypothetical protein IWQ60_000217 [Tieghemiomyces parasiticus]
MRTTFTLTVISILALIGTVIATPTRRGCPDESDGVDTAGDRFDVIEDIYEKMAIADAIDDIFPDIGMFK